MSSASSLSCLADEWRSSRCRASSGRLGKWRWQSEQLNERGMSSMGQSGRKPRRFRRDRQVAAAFSLQKGQGLRLQRVKIEGDSWPGLTVTEVQPFFLHSSAKLSGLKRTAEQLLSSVVTSVEGRGPLTTLASAFSASHGFPVRC